MLSLLGAIAHLYPESGKGGVAREDARGKRQNESYQAQPQTPPVLRIYPRILRPLAGLDKVDKGKCYGQTASQGAEELYEISLVATALRYNRTNSPDKPQSPLDHHAQALTADVRK
jgi:hypothetical protein